MSEPAQDGDLISNDGPLEDTTCKSQAAFALYSKLGKSCCSRREADAQKAVSRTAEAQLLQLTDMLKKDERVIQELNNELADKREEVSAVNRRLHTLRSLEGSSSLASQASLPAPVSLLDLQQEEIQLSASVLNAQHVERANLLLYFGKCSNMKLVAYNMGVPAHEAAMPAHCSCG